MSKVTINVDAGLKERLANLPAKQARASMSSSRPSCVVLQRPTCASSVGCLSFHVAPALLR